jgi:hypothetical protein
MSFDNPSDLTPDELERAREAVARKLTARRRRRRGRICLAAGALSAVAAGSVAVATIPGQASTPTRSAAGSGPKARVSPPVRTRSHNGATPTSTTVGPKRGTSSGAEISLPYLVGSTRSQASSNIYLQNLSVYWVSDPSSSEPTGTILSEVVGWNPSSAVPNSGGPVSEGDLPIVSVGSELGLTVAGGFQNVEVPNLLGLGEDAALQQMTQAGLVPKAQDGCMATSTENTVLTESPAAGTAVEPGSVITLIVNDSC